MFPTAHSFHRLKRLPSTSTRYITIDMIATNNSSTVATFDVPVSGHQAGNAFCYTNAYTGLIELQSYPTHVRTLALGSISTIKFEAVQFALRSFTQPFSSLEELSVTVCYPDGFPRPEDIPQLELSTDIFPSLRKLRLDGVYMDWEDSVFAQLTHVELRNCPCTDSAQFEDFLGILPTWSSLTELRLQHFLCNSTFSSDGMEVLECGYYMRPQNLRTLVVEGAAHQIPLLLYNLDVSGPDANVHIMGHWRFQAANGDNRSPFTAMVPLDDNFPVMFKSAKVVSLTVNEAEATLVGVSDVGTLTLEVPDFDRSTPSARAYALRKSLYSLTEIFATRRAPVQYLSITGDVSDVSPDDWDTLFQHVGTQLRQLTVRNTGTGRGVEHFLDALVKSFDMNQSQLVCPHLQTLAFSTCANPSTTGCMLQAVQSAIQNRARLNMPLRNLSVTVLMDSDYLNEYTPQVISSHVDAFGQCVKDEVQVRVSPLEFDSMHGESQSGQVHHGPS
ncbi:hypothetical protein C8Q80DRAFT_1141173 [Daedaleopsis nitida]|nr:hypothetical protein C8Q80DRAFT_1141173 [Daedaleopsis nitida]